MKKNNEIKIKSFGVDSHGVGPPLLTTTLQLLGTKHDYEPWKGTDTQLHLPGGGCCHSGVKGFRIILVMIMVNGIHQTPSSVVQALE
jgi:hypothetical protein